MEIADLIEGEPDSVATWTHRAYERIRARPLTDAAWQSIFDLGVDTALTRRDMNGLRSVLSLAATYYDSIGDQFGCLPNFEATMARVQGDPQARAVVLECTHDILIGNS
ncbi:MAG: hypothetical protein WC211_07155 [Dehalococcoidia bacterium]